MVSKRRNSKIRRRGYTEKTTHNIQNTAKVWNQEYNYPVYHINEQILWNVFGNYETFCIFLQVTYIAMSRTEDELEDKVWIKDKSFQYLVVNNANKRKHLYGLYYAFWGFMDNIVWCSNIWLSYVRASQIQYIFTVQPRSCNVFSIYLFL
jgi:hypothetical protein